MWWLTKQTCCHSCGHVWCTVASLAAALVAACIYSGALSRGKSACTLRSADTILPGVQRVAICDDGSTDGTAELPELFRSRGVGGVIIEEAPAPRDGTDGQLSCYNQCLARYRHDTDWFIVAVRARSLVATVPAAAGAA